MKVRLVEFAPDDVDGIEAWFDDAETQRWLGGRDWIRRAPSLLTLTIGDEFRGKIVTGRRMWLGLDDAGVAVSFMDAETYDRYTAWDASDRDHPRMFDIVEVPSMALTVVVDPQRRREGFGSATLRALIEHPETSRVKLFFGSVEAANTASIACVTRAGFRLRSPEPDFEDMLHFSFER